MPHRRLVLAAALGGLATVAAAPPAAADSVVVGAKADGRTVVVDRGDLLKVRVVESPSQGSSWSIARRPSRPTLRYVEQGFLQDDAPEGTVGVPGKRTYVWRAGARGRTSLRLVLRAPGTEKQIDRVAITVRVR